MLALLDAGYSVTVFDNLDNSFLECFERMKELAGPEKAAKMTFVKGDLRDAAAIDAALGAEKFDAVIHFAGRKAVGESVAEPMLYYTHNVAGTVNLIEAMRKHGVRDVSPFLTFFFFFLLSSPPCSSSSPLSLSERERRPPLPFFCSPSRHDLLLSTPPPPQPPPTHPFVQ